MNRDDEVRELMEALREIPEVEVSGMTRDDFIRAGAQAIYGRGYFNSEECAADVLDAIEELIRADERERNGWAPT